MAEPISESMSSGLVSGASEILPQELLNNLSLFMDLGKIALIIVFIYFITWIISSIIQAQNSRKNYKLLKQISETLDKINKKLPNKNPRKK